MPSDRYRILELALESLEIKKKQIDAEIAEINRELRGKPARKAPLMAQAAANQAPAAKKQARFSKEERMRRSRRMKAYWDNWRKKKSHAK